MKWFEIVLISQTHDAQLKDFATDGSHCLLWNYSIANLKESMGTSKWFDSPWLFVECLMYKLINDVFEASTHWKHFDIFASQKLVVLQS
jgi:hypothetical protein